MQPQMELAPVPAVESVSVPPETAPVIRWNTGLNIGFRFTFAYFVMYCLPFPLGTLPFTDKPAEWYELLWHKGVPWAATHIFKLSHPITAFTNGSGDTTYDYMKALCSLIIALVITVVWSILDRNRPNYQYLHRWFNLYVRITLGAVLLSYGAAKVVPSQFPAPWLWRYIQTYGESSPMGILWTFMGVSKSYTIFAGAVEMLGGILLFVPRLATLGALVSIMAMGNVFMLNMSYDVPVKLYSFHLLAMSVVLVFPEFKRLAGFFVLNRTVEPSFHPPLFRKKWAAYTLLIAQLAFGVWLSGSNLYNARKTMKTYFVDGMITPPLFGIWTVDEFNLDGKQHPPLLTDDVRWQRVVFEYKNLLTAQGMDGKLIRLGAKIDSDKKTIELTKRADPNWKSNINYQMPTQDRMVVDGTMAGKPFSLKMHRMDTQFLLKTRGFHWINEFPFNR